MIPGTQCDVLVIGHGAAGCVAAAALAARGLDVIVVGMGTTATELSTARVSLPGDDGRQLTELFRTVGASHGLYGASAGKVSAISCLGTISSQDMTSAHDWLVSDEGRTAVLGLRGNGCMDPDAVCRSLSRRLPDLECRPLWTDLGVPAEIYAGSGGRLSDEALEAVDLLRGPLSDIGEDLVVMPPLFSGPLHAQALDRLEVVSGRHVREPATPLSVPGRRLQACLEDHARRSGCRLLKGREARRLVVENGVATGAAVRSGLREQAIGFRAAVLALGNLIGGGLAIAGEELIAPIGPLRTGGPLAGGMPLTSVLSSGLLDRGGRAVLDDGTAVDNLTVAGSALAGLSFPLGRGLGDVASSALEAAASIMEAL